MEVEGGRGMTRMMKSPMSREEEEECPRFFFMSLLFMQTRMIPSPMSQTHSCIFNPHVRVPRTWRPAVYNSMKCNPTSRSQSQHPLLKNLLIALHLIAHFKLCPILKPHAAFIPLSHFRHVLFDVFEGGECT